MIKKVFIDTDVVLDVALAREPFFEYSKGILILAENGIVFGNTSSNCIANIYYILRKAGNDKKARKFLLQILKYLNVIAIEHQDIIKALKSDFSDFEDAVQNCTAVKYDCDYIITRNVNDYKESGLRVCLPFDYLKLYQ